MSRTILISSVLLTILSVLSLGDRVSAQDREDSARKDKGKKEQAQEDPFEVPDPFADENPFGDDLPAEIDPFGSEPQRPSIQPATEKPSKKPTRNRIRTLRHGEEAILKVLEEPTVLEFFKLPLVDAVDILKNSHRLAIHIDRRALDDIGMDLEQPVTIDIRGISLRSGLNLMLDQLELTWTIRDDVLVITTRVRTRNYPVLVTKVYDVSDLVFPVADQPYDGRRLPTVPLEEQLNAFVTPGRGTGDRGMNGGMGGAGMNGAMGQDKPVGAGMGMFNVSDDLGDSSIEPRTKQHTLPAGRIGNSLATLPGPICGGIGLSLDSSRQNSGTNADMESLIAGITSTIEPVSWEEVGGMASVKEMGRLLVISQTVRVHQQIENLLKMIRAAQRAVPTVVVDARWVLHESKSADPITLERLKDATPGARARIGCTSGQLVHLASGERRTVAVGAIPVIDGAAVGYRPEIAFPNVGIVLEVRPTVTHDRKSVTLDVRNIVTQWDDPAPPIKVQGDSAEVDRVKMPTQQLAATMRVPLGKPVLIGGMTLAPTDAGPKKELYLVIEMSIVEAQ